MLTGSDTIVGKKNQTGPWPLHRLSVAWALLVLHKTENICASYPLSSSCQSMSSFCPFFLVPSSASPYNCHYLSNMSWRVLQSRPCPISAADINKLAKHLQSWAPAPSSPGKRHSEQPLPMVTELAKLNWLKFFPHICTLISGSWRLKYKDPLSRQTQRSRKELREKKVKSMHILWVDSS